MEIARAARTARASSDLIMVDNYLDLGVGIVGSAAASAAALLAVWLAEMVPTCAVPESAVYLMADACEVEKRSVRRRVTHVASATISDPYFSRQISATWHCLPL